MNAIAPSTPADFHASTSTLGSQSTAVSTPTCLSFPLDTTKQQHNRDCCRYLEEKHSREIAKLRKDQAQLRYDDIQRSHMQLRTELAKAQTELAAVLSDRTAALGTMQTLKAENERLARELRTSRKSEQEYADLAESFQQMLRGFHTECEHKIRQLSSSLSSDRQLQAGQQPSVTQNCSRCKFVRHTDSASLAPLRAAIADLKASCDVARSNVVHWRDAVVAAEETSQRAQKRADFWMAKATAMSAIPPARSDSRLGSDVRWINAAENEAEMQTIVTRPECKFETLEETLKASKFWLRPLGRLKPRRGTVKKQQRLSAAVSTPNLRQAAVTKNTTGPTVFTLGLATPGASPLAEPSPSPTFSKFDFGLDNWPASPVSSVYSLES